MADANSARGAIIRSQCGVSNCDYWHWFVCRPCTVHIAGSDSLMFNCYSSESFSIIFLSVCGVASLEFQQGSTYVRNTVKYCVTVCMHWHHVCVHKIMCTCIIIWDVYACRFMFMCACYTQGWKAMHTHIWFILDLIRCNVLSPHVGDSSGVGLNKNRYWCYI